MLHLFKKKPKEEVAPVSAETVNQLAAKEQSEERARRTKTLDADFIIGISRSVSTIPLKIETTMLKKQKPYHVKVADEFRKHPWSTQPGGVTLIVEYLDGSTHEYDKVKNVEAYSRKLLTNPDVKTVKVKE